MARVQIMPLPAVDGVTPFILVFDHTDDLRVTTTQYTAFKEQTGATAIWVIDQGQLDVANPLPLTAEQGQAILDRLTTETPQ